jgi:hypothetical protein
MPDGCDFFCDPCKAIQHYRGCELNRQKSGENHALGSVYKFVTGKPLVDAHNSLADAKAQMTIVLDDRYMFKYFDTVKSIQPMEDALSAKERNEIKHWDELTRPMPDGWVEEPAGEETEWDPPYKHSYLGPAGGPKHGPTKAARDAAMAPNATIVDLFLLILPLSLMESLATHTNNYATRDWVHPVVAKDQNGIVRKKTRLTPCHIDQEGARHRATSDYVPMTAGYLFAWIGVLIAIGAYKLRKARLIWMSAPYGVGIPWIQNAMPRDRFESARRFLHFADNTQLPAKGQEGWSPLGKLKNFMDEVMELLQNAWTIGMKICIDESMVLYTGRAVSFVQYMPAKPIKHGIKLFALCCSYTGICYGWEVYTGNRGDPAGTAVTSLVVRLIRETCHLDGHKGRVLFTDNWYTSMALATKLWEEFSMLFVGTMSLTNKGCRTMSDFPFDKLSKIAQGKVDRGWFRRAVRISPGHRKCVLQATVWMDRKLVGFLHSAQVSKSAGHTVLRWDRKQNKRVPIATPPVTHEYSDCMGAVDMTDGDGANYSVSFRSNRWYLRLFSWVLERVIHAAFQLTIFFAQECKEEWKCYTSKEEGRYNFQIDLAMQLIDYGIRLDWKGDADNPKNDAGKPAWVRQVGLIPCDCKRCFFCRTGRTQGIDHKPLKRTRENVVPRGHARKREKVSKNGRVCQFCYKRLGEKYATMASAEKKMKSARSTLGCRMCGLCVCGDCWHLFEHVNNNVPVNLRKHQLTNSSYYSVVASI